MYALIDCNNFYASCERVFVPRLNGKPIVVLSNNDGCVIARSDEAKEAGIPMGAPAFKYKHIFKEKNINVFSSNYPLYADMSNRVIAVIRSFVPDIEVYSIDESFVNFKGFEKYDLKSYSLEMKERIFQITKMPVCIGVAPTKTLAKVANRIAKKFPVHHNGVYVIDSKEKIDKALKWLQAGNIWGIGRRLSKRLSYMNINTAWDFTQLSDEYIKKNFSIVELRLKKELLGESVLQLDEIVRKKSIATTRSFDHNVKDYEYLKERVSTFSVSCAEKLRQQKSKCNIVTVYVATNRFDTENPYYSRAMSIQLPYDSNSNIIISKYALKVLDIIALDKYEYKKAGVIVSSIVLNNQMQMDMFSFENPKHEKLMNVLDKMNAKLGKGKVKLASQDLERTWKMKQDNLSPCYTTKWEHLMRV